MRKRQENIQLQVGAFVGVGFLLLMLVIFLLGSEKKLFDTQYSLYCHFENISGLRVGAPVQLAGINVGSVNNVEFDDSLDKQKVRLRLRISTRYGNRIREDSEATIVTQGLLGDKMIYISVGSSETKVLEDGAVVKTGSPGGFYELIDKGGDLILSATQTTDHINAILGEVREGKGLIHGLIYDPEGEKMMQDVKEMAHYLRDAMAQLDYMTVKINRGQGTIGALVNDATLFNDFKTLLGKANRNKLIRAVIRETLKTRDEKLHKK